MGLQQSATERKTGIRVTSDLASPSTLAVRGTPAVRPMPWAEIIGATIGLAWAGYLLSPVGAAVIEGLFPQVSGELGDPSALLLLRLAAFGVGLTLIVMGVTVANRASLTPAVAPETPATDVAPVPDAALQAVAEPVEWIGEVTPVTGQASGSMEVYGDTLSSDLEIIDNISPLKIRKLEGIGIRSRADLLKIGRSQLGRQDIARRTGIGVRQLTDWLNKADLLRIDGEPALDMASIRLLEVAGIETIDDLAVARPEAIHRKLIEFGKRQGPNCQLPSLADIAGWVGQAGQLTP